MGEDEILHHTNEEKVYRGRSRGHSLNPDCAEER